MCYPCFPGSSLRPTLMETLNCIEPRYIRCVKLNNLLKPDIFYNVNIMQQLRCGGVLEAIPISCAGYPTCKSFSDFVNRFSILAPEVKKGNLDAKVACKKILDKVGIQGSQVKHVVLASMALKGVCGILFVFGSITGAYLLIYYLLLMTLLLHDFYDYEMDDPEFHPRLADFVQSLALLGALLFFIGMKNVLPRKLIKEKPLKAKTT